MKKIIIIFITILFLLSIIGISYSDEGTMSPGKAWNDLTIFDTNENNISVLVKACYIKGFRDGAVVSGALSDTGSSGLERIEELCIFISENNEAIWKGMDELYKDPANTNIEWSTICQIACGKLMGSENIEEALERARQK